MKKIIFFAGLAFILLSAWSCQKGETTDTPFIELSTTESVALVASVDEVDAIIDDNIENAFLQAQEILNLLHPDA